MSFSEWKTYKISEIASLKYGKLPKKELITPLGEYPVFTGYRNSGFYPEYNCETGDIIVVARGVGGTGDVKLIKEKCWLTNLAIQIKLNNDIADNKFFYYSYFKNNLKHLDSGSAQSQITILDLGRAEVVLPDFKSQLRIASILSSLDDAIELNQQINKTLEEMAKAIFKEWFVDFNFPNATGKFQETEIGKIPVGWKQMKLSEALEIKYGKDHKHLQEGDIPVYGSGGIMRFAEKPLYENESILIPRKGTLSNLFYINKPFWTVDTMFYSTIKIINSGKYLFHLLQTLNLASMNVGSAVPSLTTEVLNNIQIAMPDENTLKEFEKIVSSLFNQAAQNIEESQSLSNLRDTLLPKLMKGEININL